LLLGPRSGEGCALWLLSFLLPSVVRRLPTFFFVHRRNSAPPTCLRNATGKVIRQ